MVEAMNAVRGIEDGPTRAKAISELLKQQAEDAPGLREERRRIVQEMRDREPPVSFRKIAAQLGVSVGTVQDIVRGHSGPWGDRRKGTEGAP